MTSIIKKSYKIFVYLTLIFIYSNFNTIYASDFIARGYYVIDLSQKIEWLRCPVGMIWENKKCTGKALKLKFDEVEQAKIKAGKQLGGFWRLPNRDELEKIVCHNCKDGKINSKVFPNTPPESFWTSDQNSWQPRFIWTVNFFTGYTFGRFPGFIPNFVRLVRDRK